MLGTEDLRALLPQIKVPVAVVVGREDYATPVSMAEALHAAIPQSTLTVIGHGRHITPVECPHEIARELKKLIGA
jgi:3-oxoadipate enol-lactonase